MLCAAGRPPGKTTMFSERITGYLTDLGHGTLLTVQLVVMAIILGFLLSFPLVWMRRSRWRGLSGFSSIYSFVMRGTPLLVQMYLLYYGLSQFDAVRNSILWNGFLESPYWCSLLALVLNAAGYKAEILDGALRSVDYGAQEAGRAMGMTQRQVFWRISYPQAIRLAVPGYTNEVILLIKGSALASTLTLMELTGVTRTIVAKTYQPLQWFLLAGVIYLLLNSMVAWLFRRWEQYLHPWQRQTLAQR
jgi:polar amino acid transport system permease protein